MFFTDTVCDYIQTVFTKYVLQLSKHVRFPFNIMLATLGPYFIQMCITYVST